MSRPFSEPDVFAAIADPTRRAILDLLAKKELPVRELARPFKVSLPAISQHLKILRGVELVTQRQVGRERYYRVNPGPLREISDWVSFYERFWKRKIGKLRKQLEDKK